MPYKAAEIEHILTTVLGFVEDDTREVGHKWYKLKIEGVPRTIRTKISHGKKTEYGAALESAVAKQLHVRKAFFRDIMAGKKTREDYIREVKANPYPPF
ncbi:MAG TPA: hypothetical protein VJN88_03925 [Ktedonobacterales bacterium]|nr:hypothetical protein [Ktedonobacterales bacterium]